jgi:hypothetical protein
MEDIFIEMIKENIDDLRSGKLPKAKFIGRYMDALKKSDPDNAFRFKRPQVIGIGEPENNWLDYIFSRREYHKNMNLTL